MARNSIGIIQRAANSDIIGHTKRYKVRYPYRKLAVVTLSAAISDLYKEKYRTYDGMYRTDKLIYDAMLWFLDGSCIPYIQIAGINEEILRSCIRERLYSVFLKYLKYKDRAEIPLLKCTCDTCGTDFFMSSDGFKYYIEENDSVCSVCSAKNSLDIYFAGKGDQKLCTL